MTTIDIDAIRQRVEAASPGPWIAHPDGLVWTQQPIPGDPVSGSTEIEDAEFIAHARTDIPALLAENLRLREQVFAQKPVIEAAEAWAEMCEDGGIAPDDCRKSEDALFGAVESYRVMDMALTSARAEDEEDVRCDHDARLDVECRPCLVETYGQREAGVA